MQQILALGFLPMECPEVSLGLAGLRASELQVGSRRPATWQDKGMEWVESLRVAVRVRLESLDVPSLDSATRPGRRRRGGDLGVRDEDLVRQPLEQPLIVGAGREVGLGEAERRRQLV